MPAPLSELHVKAVVDLGLSIIRSNPDKYLPEIFGDYCIGPQAPVLGNRIIAQIKKWVLTTKVAVKMGFDLNPTEMPCVAINIISSNPSMPYIGSIGIQTDITLQAQEKEVIIPAFAPAGVVYSSDNSHIILTLPTSMPFDETQVFVPGLIIRDSKNREYGISNDKDGNLLIIQTNDTAPLSEIDLTRLELISPVIEARFTGGAMSYDETVQLGIFGHSSRQEGLWLYNIVMWSLLKFRPILTSTFGLDLGLPSASDYSKEDAFQGENIWRRFISLQVKTVWSWEGARQKDILNLLLTIHQTSNSGN